ncbi:MAG: class I SAM-dependent methyltransferase [Planctomycetes bacterium]|nr:class I SAM-dependent methyltransferase [Planctomycetota bacterium]
MDTSSAVRTRRGSILPALQLVPNDTPPRRLVCGVEWFKIEMASIEQMLARPHAAETKLQRRVNAACDGLVAELRLALRRAADPAAVGAVGALVAAEAGPILLRSRHVDRCVRKPRGYAGDYLTIEMLYTDEPAGAGALGRLIDRWALDLPAVRAVRYRRRMMTDLLRRRLETRRTAGSPAGPGPAQPAPMRVTSLASGPARELFDLFAEDANAAVHATCIDIDEEALQFTSRLADELGIAERFTLRRENLIHVALGRTAVSLPAQEFIYSVGLIDYLSDRLVVALLDWIHDRLEPGGMAAIGNFDPGNPDQPFMDHLLDWKLTHRDRARLAGLFARSKFGGAPVRIVTDPTGVQLLALCERPRAGGGPLPTAGAR